MTAGILFVSSAAALVVAGTWLARAADAIAERTGLARIWIGTILLAGATSLPELASDVAAVRQGNPDLAAGDLFGSSMANMLILALLDLSSPSRRVLRRASVQHAMSASLAIVLTAIAGAAVLAPRHPSILGAGLFSVTLAVVYTGGAYLAWNRRPREGERTAPRKQGVLRPALTASVIRLPRSRPRGLTPGGNGAGGSYGSRLSPSAINTSLTNSLAFKDSSA